MGPPANQKRGSKAPANRQATVEPEEGESSRDYDGDHGAGEQSGELITTAGGDQASTPPPLPVLPGFSEQQVHSMIGCFQNMLHTTLQQYLPRNPTSTTPLSTIPLPTIESPEPSHTFGAVHHTNSRQLRAEEVGYFDPEYQQEQGTTNGPIVNAGKHVFYKDVYVFTDRLKDLAVQYGETNIKAVMTACFRGSVLMWYSMELTDLERTLLRDANLDLWYTTLINRFKTRTAVALSQLVGQMYGLADIRHTSPRAFIQQMLHLAKSAEMTSVYNQLCLIWNQFDVNLRRDIPEPRPSTTIGQFFNQVDSKTSIWLELSQRQSQRQQQRQWHREPTLQGSTLDRQASGQRNGAPQQHSGPYKGNNNRLAPRIPMNDSKSHAYLADVTPDGYGVYEEEDEANQEHHNS